ncbi:MAG: PHP domain-containing protein [Firmicutes bacterium]|nr:PHP domain-containing protein [Bacillota bacterium]
MSEKRVDLHCHTTASDGTFTPGELVRAARDRGLAAIGITDHDSVDALDAGMEEGSRIGVEVVPGVEISTDVEDSEVHILGYFIDHHDERLGELLSAQRQSRRERVGKMLEKLATLGVKLTFDEVLDVAGDGAVGRPHVAAALIRAGYATSWEDAFLRYIGRRAPAYVRRSKLGPVEAVSEIRAASGVPVMAHPGLNHMDHIIPELVAAGLRGIEAIYPEHSQEQCEHYEKIARKYGLVVTAGSDCHGPRSKSGVILGRATTDYLAVNQLRRIHQGMARA